MMVYNKNESRELSHNRADIHSLPPPSTSLMCMVGACSDPGKRKERNEDGIFAVSSTWRTPTLPFSVGLFVVADGMGGYANGQDASCCAIQAMVNCIWPKVVRENTFQAEDHLALLAEAMQIANKAVCQQNLNLHSREGTDVDVGVLTTVTAAMIVGSTAYIAHVGNCRAYHYRPGAGLKQATTDHSVVARLVREGVLTQEDVYTHRQRRQIYRALFDQPSVEVDLFTVPLQLGDTLLLCSMGLWDMVRDPKIEDVLSFAPSDPAKAAEGLVQVALNQGGQANVSVIVVSMAERSHIPMPGTQLFATPASLYLPQT